MNKTVYVPSYFQPIYKEVTVKVPTGNTKRFLGFIDIEEKIRKKEVVQEGWSDCQVDGERLNEDITRTVDKLNQDGFEVISITPVTSGNVFFINAIVMLMAKVITMCLCWIFSIFIAPVGLAYLYYYHSRGD
ncbi:hypothetical protein [Salmonella enterica]|uniref:hypothetical protein n=1 Tax=Salmonella enterica TaxID=28901 RepID=UPI00217EA493|nr:hypothetical protein [Salmonella enterica]